MSTKNKKTKALAPARQQSLSRRTLIRSWESDVATGIQQEQGRPEDQDDQAIVTLLRNPDGSPKRFVMPMTNKAQALGYKDAIDAGIGISVQLHRLPTDDELTELQHELAIHEGPHLVRELPAHPIVSSGIESAVRETWTIKPKPGKTVKIDSQVRDARGRIGRVVKVLANDRAEVEIIEVGPEQATS